MRGRPGLYTNYSKESAIFANNTQKFWFMVVVVFAVSLCFLASEYWVLLLTTSFLISVACWGLNIVSGLAGQNLVANTSFDRQTIPNQKSLNDNVSIVNEPESPPVAPPGRSDLTDITSPMVGTFYRAAAPGEDPFVEIGSNVKVGQTICILEAMKLMNEIESEFNSEIVEILVENGTPVEFGQVLMRVKQS